MGFASLNVVCDELNDCTKNVCLFQFSDWCMYIVSKALLISGATLIVRAWGAIWLNLFAAVLFRVCMAVTVECCFYTRVVCVFSMFAVMQGRRLFSSVFSITERRDMDLYEVPLYVSLLGYVIGTMLANFHVRVIMLRAV